PFALAAVAFDEETLDGGEVVAEMEGEELAFAQAGGLADEDGLAVGSVYQLGAGDGFNLSGMGVDDFGGREILRDILGQSDFDRPIVRAGDDQNAVVQWGFPEHPSDADDGDGP